MEPNGIRYAIMLSLIFGLGYGNSANVSSGRTNKGISMRIAKLGY